MNRDQINLVKVFSASRATERAFLGERITQWLAAHRDADIVSTTVELTSDRRFHCLSIVLFCSERLQTESVVTDTPMRLAQSL